MKCSLRSTRLPAKRGFRGALPKRGFRGTAAKVAAGVVLGLAVVASSAPLTAAGDPGAAITAAIEQAVRARMRAGVTVRITQLSGIRLAAGAEGIVAQAPPTARIGAPIRFMLSERVGNARARTGEATATFTVVADAVRTVKDVTRGAKVDAGDVVVQASDLIGQPLAPLPSLEDAIGARARRDIGIDVVVTRADIAAEPLVRAGDIVRAHVRVGSAEVTGRLVAAEPGGRNEIIRVVNPETRHTTRARIVKSGEVEVLNVR
jgi:flagella basal body P-ring formation protein FlgA